MWPIFTIPFFESLFLLKCDSWTPTWVALFYWMRPLPHTVLVISILLLICKRPFQCPFLTRRTYLSVQQINGQGDSLVVKKFHAVSKQSLGALFYKNQLFLGEAQLFLIWTRFWPSFNLDPPPPLNYIFKILLVISSLRFPDHFASSMNICQNTNSKITNLRLPVLIKKRVS